MNGWKLEVLTPLDSAKWRDILDRTSGYDTYHLPAYHRVAEANGEGRANLLVFQHQDHVMAFPMLIRDIEMPGTRAVGGLKDTTSAYGYGGPVASANLPDDIRRRFMEMLDDYYRSSDIVSAFSRLHPMLDTYGLLAGYGELVELGPTISVDLTLSPEEQFANFSRAHRRDLKQLACDGFSSRIFGSERLDEFLQIYYETMARNRADDYYYFDRAYFRHLFDDMPDITKLFACMDGDIIVSVVIAFRCNGIVQGHLGGTLSRYLYAAPMKMVFDSMRRWGTEAGAHSLHLGGGIGGQRDTLFQFKKGFSKREHACRVWRHVVDKEAYNELCREMCRQSGVHPESEYFPLYRHPDFEEARVECELDSKAAAIP